MTWDNDPYNFNFFKLHELIGKALGRDVDEAVTMKRMYELMEDKMVRICS